MGLWVFSDCGSGVGRFMTVRELCANADDCDAATSSIIQSSPNLRMLNTPFLWRGERLGVADFPHELHSAAAMSGRARFSHAHVAALERQILRLERRERAGQRAPIHGRPDPRRRQDVHGFIGLRVVVQGVSYGILFEIREGALRRWHRQRRL